ncbi:hypothetical protein CJ030_MR1G022544 [Morella rubra]|uniref:Uncharacterized protein n=1 Tax=Morella rubra TaxID=262757 RepID=A0A6A1WSH6_9ROSI|nr:hypothetical protein CJ030_MR1G022544 [Morella rubra]
MASSGSGYEEVEAGPVSKGTLQLALKVSNPNQTDLAGYSLEFAWCYKIMTSKFGMHFFQPRDGCGLFSCLPSNNKGWHKRFFFISGEGGNSLRGKKIQLGLVGCCDVSRETPDLTLEEDLRIKRAMEGKPWDVAKQLPSASAAATASGASTAAHETRSIAARRRAVSPSLSRDDVEIVKEVPAPAGA